MKRQAMLSLKDFGGDVGGGNTLISLRTDIRYVQYGTP